MEIAIWIIFLTENSDITYLLHCQCQLIFLLIIQFDLFPAHPVIYDGVDIFYSDRIFLSLSFTIHYGMYNYIKTICIIGSEYILIG